MGCDVATEPEGGRRPSVGERSWASTSSESESMRRPDQSRYTIRTLKFGEPPPYGGYVNDDIADRLWQLNAGEPPLCHR